MSRLKKDWFEPHVRFTHRFGQSADAGSMLGERTFDPEIPNFPDKSSPPLFKKQRGEHSYMEPMSPVVKPSGRAASSSGPAADYPKEIAMPVPVGTRKRKSIK